MRKLLALFTLLLMAGAIADPSALEGLKTSSAANKAALAKYSWQEVQTLSVDGEVKSTTTSTVRWDDQGKPVKSNVRVESAPQKSVRGPLRNRVKERKVDEFKDYMKKVAALAQAYAQPDPEKLQAAFKSGNLTVDTSGGPAQSRFTFKSYLKPNDAFVLVYDRPQKAIKSVMVNSYLDQPGDVVEIDCTFASLPDGTNHLAQSTVVGQEKAVTIVTKNSGYVKL